jgi:heme/copper-type cytochrome/quinol oxidase subunit 3
MLLFIVSEIMFFFAFFWAFFCSCISTCNWNWINLTTKRYWTI